MRHRLTPDSFEHLALEAEYLSDRLQWPAVEQKSDDLEINEARPQTEREKRAAQTQPLYEKLDALDKYAENLFNMDAEDLDDAVEGSNKWMRSEKQDILMGFSEDIRSMLDGYNNSKYLTIDMLVSQISFKANVILNNNEHLLAEHRLPVLRWLKEFLMLCVTLFVGTAVKTGVSVYQEYTSPKNKEHFLLSNVEFGFFAKTESINKVQALLDTAKQLEGMLPPAEPNLYGVEEPEPSRGFSLY